MRQPKDTTTADMPVAGRRGRGRPRLENALTAAERAKRYRDKKRAQRALQRETGVTKNKPVTKNRHATTVPVDQLIAEQRRSEVLRACVDMFIDYRMKKKAMPPDIFRNICQTVLKV